jgi:DNA repair protein RadA/Sms
MNGQNKNNILAPLPPKGGELTIWNYGNCYILTETSKQNIFKQIELLEPNLLIVDSIQTFYSAHIESSPESVSQIRECTSELMRYAKESGTALIGKKQKN